ncbi:MAG: cation diffusion facilitator family transporter [Bacillota bacterium]
MQKVAKTALLGVFINGLVFIIKYLLALYSGSIAIKAEAFHSLADVLASITVFGGVIFANRKTRMFPYGLYKVENLVSMLVGLIIIFAGYEIVMNVFTKSEVAINNSWLNIIGICVVIFITYAFSRYEAKIGREAESPGLTADSEHIMVDMIGNVLILAVLISNYAGFNIDKMAALVVAVFIFWVGGKVIYYAIRVLLDASLENEILNQVKDVILSNPMVERVQSITGRSSGQFKFIEANISVNMQELSKAHSLVDEIEKDVKKRIKNVNRILIHYEPAQKESYLYAKGGDFMPFLDGSGPPRKRKNGGIRFRVRW